MAPCCCVLNLKENLELIICLLFHGSRKRSHLNRLDSQVQETVMAYFTMLSNNLLWRVKQLAILANPKRLLSLKNSTDSTQLLLVRKQKGIELQESRIYTSFLRKILRTYNAKNNEKEMAEEEERNN